MMSGPATDALERSFKRIRVDEPKHSMSYINSAFNFVDAFDAIDSVSNEENYFEPFPKIAWSFDDDETDTPAIPSLPAPLSSSSSSRKRNHSGLVRSKTFSQDLNKLAEEAEQSPWNCFGQSDDENTSTPSLSSSPRSVLSEKTFCSVSTTSTCDASSRMMRTSTSNSFLSRRPSRSMLLVSYGNSRLFSATNAF